MGFFRDLFGARQPCDLCQLGKAQWPAAHSGSADWKLRGEGLNADLLICPRCFDWVRKAGLGTKNPILALAYLVRSGQAERPPAHAYLQHPEWKKVWMHSLDQAGIGATDDFAALAAIREIEQEMIGGDEVPEAFGLDGFQPKQPSDLESVAERLFSFALRAAQQGDESLAAQLGEQRFQNRTRAFRYSVDLLIFALLPVDMVVARLYGSRADEVRSALRDVYTEHVSRAANEAGIMPELGYEIATALMMDRFPTYTDALKSRDEDGERGLAIGAAAYREILGETGADPNNAVILGLAFYRMLSQAKQDVEQLMEAPSTGPKGG